MTKAPQLPDAQGSDDQVDADLFDYAAIKAWLGFVWRSVGRHRVVGAVTFVLVLGLATFFSWVVPKKFESTTTLLANRDDLMAQLGNPHRMQSFDMDGPTRAAQEQVLSRQNLEAMIKSTNLVEHWDQNRHPVLKLKDKLFGEAPADQKFDNMVGTLEKRLNVFTGPNGTVTITIYWPHAAMARQLVETAQQNFLEMRHSGEVNAIGEAISILELRAGEAQQAIDESIENVQKVAEERTKGGKEKSAKPAAPVKPKAVAAGTETPQQELSQLKFLIRNKRRAISDLEEFRSRRLTELQGQLAEQKVIYSDSHPVVLDIKERIEAMQKESPQIQQLRRDEEALIEEYKSRGGKDVNANAEPGSARPRNVELELDNVLRDVLPDLRDDPAVTAARDQLRMATARYQDILMRIDAARIELDTARAAFKYRYSVVRPAQTPRKPVSPNVVLIVLGGFFGGIVFAFFAAAAIDTWRGKVVEVWQVEKKLGLQVLADIRQV